LPVIGLVNTGRMLGILEIKMQGNYYIPESQNEDAAKIAWFTLAVSVMN